MNARKRYIWPETCTAPPPKNGRAPLVGEMRLRGIIIEAKRKLRFILFNDLPQKTLQGWEYQTRRKLSKAIKDGPGKIDFIEDIMRNLKKGRADEM